MSFTELHTYKYDYYFVSLHQVERMDKRATLQEKVDVLMGNLTDMIDRIGTDGYDATKAVGLLDQSGLCLIRTLLQFKNT